MSCPAAAAARAHEIERPVVFAVAATAVADQSLACLMKPNVKALIYTILADDKPVAVLEASAGEARDLIKKRWLVAELTALKVDGHRCIGEAPGCACVPHSKRNGSSTTRSAAC